LRERGRKGGREEGKEGGREEGNWSPSSTLGFPMIVNLLS